VSTTSIAKLAVVLTIAFDVVDLLARFLPPTFADGYDEPIALVMLSFYPLMAVRWTLVLILLLRKVRVRPFRVLPSAFALQAVFVVIAHTMMGLLSLVGWLAWMVSSDTGSHVLGFLFHIALPTLIVFGLARSAARDERGATVKS